MSHFLPPSVRFFLRHHLTLILSVLVVALVASGCDALGIKRKVNVPSLLSPLAEADTQQLLAEVNRLATVKSIRGKVDIQFLDTSFAECGVAERYRTADGSVVIQRPGQIFLRIQVPFVGQDVAQMTSDGERFRVAVLMGEERNRRFVQGTNAAIYPRVENEPATSKNCNDDRQNKMANERRAVSALSGLRPQHFTDALLIRAVEPQNSAYIYVRTESFEEEADARPGASKNSRVVRGYYLLDEIGANGDGQRHTLRRFWFDRFGGVRLARLQTFDARGLLATDVYFEAPQKFGPGGEYLLPSRVVLTRPQDRYSLRVTYQAPEATVINNSYPPDLFSLENKWQLPEVNLDQKKEASRQTTQAPQSR